MLTLRSEQMQALRAVALDAYRAELLEHFRTFAPDLFKVAGEVNFREFIRLGTDKALRIGLNLRGPMRTFVELMCLLGSDFDLDPQYRPLWPEGDPAAIPMPFAQRLHANFIRYRQACIGDHKALLIAALTDCRNVPLEPIGSLADWLEGTLRAIYPSKLDYMGQTNLRDLVAACETLSHQAQIETPRGKALICILSIAFGLNFQHNPLYPWVMRRLINDDPEPTRIDKTYVVLDRYASAALDNLNEAR